MPKRTIEDDEMPRRRRGAKAVAVDAEEERGFVMRMLLRSPKDMLAGALAVAAIGAILTNALFLQAGRHPSPMFGSVVKLPAPAPVAANPLPRPRPVELVRSAEPPEPKPVESRNADPKTTDPKSADPKNTDPMTNLVVRSTGSAPAAAASSTATPVAKPNGSVPAATSHVARPPAPVPASAQSAGARRVASVQRALTEYGYGQLKPTGAVGSDTQAAITKFERDRKLPVTGQMSDRLVKELTAMTGRPIE
ncbi:peptidoglycan-binding protein [Bradyrhizobium sp. AUGA SZCCT0240]|uniref:peptidoglycan-binding domain-containing protein n=1 Tax=unclassified Bradyrhizobium TaxID=2631580 RepID=UPI001BA8105D|nr:MULTISPECIES: peptidoglycan-binding domain-containing protein [unclassified Bradyrhizobium]MBR1199836.1 peptidoglycan-binding protein [Bradyrhizobium sp. AUGA SZCCT0158]MBR1239127.1 peptidoglycan-binding protein [Bradyrhizobium sp. AUGA SZCCT0274]MBR1255416.1 peptidoglycan-binding protein [Bradyrhizobium sp. AUGA SZCCT0240]